MTGEIPWRSGGATSSSAKDDKFRSNKQSISSFGGTATSNGFKVATADISSDELGFATKHREESVHKIQ
jgi:hypothetical protein